MLESRKDEDLARKCREVMVSSLTQRSVADAQTFVETVDVMDRERRDPGDLLFRTWACQVPRKALAGWLARGENGISTPISDALRSWCSDAEGARDAVDWILALDSGSAKERLKGGMVTALLANRQFSHAALLGSCIADPDDRSSVLATVRCQWHGNSPTTYLKWLSELPAKDREAFGL